MTCDIMFADSVNKHDDVVSSTTQLRPDAKILYSQDNSEANKNVDSSSFDLLPPPNKVDLDDSTFNSLELANEILDGDDHTNIHQMKRIDGKNDDSIPQQQSYPPQLLVVDFDDFCESLFEEATEEDLLSLSTSDDSDKYSINKKYNTLKLPEIHQHGDRWLHDKLPKNKTSSLRRNDEKSMQASKTMEDREMFWKSDNTFLSSDWTITFCPLEDIEYTYENIFEHDLKKEDKLSPPVGLSLAKRTDWNSLYLSAIAPQQAQKQTPCTVASKSVTTTSKTTKTPTSATTTITTTTTTTNRKKKRCRKRKIVPKNKVYTTLKKMDVVCGRGGKSNHHEGNKMYREKVKTLKPKYLAATEIHEKTRISQEVVDYVHSLQGRFLDKDKDGRWYIIPNITARRKASQALRDDNSPETLAAKREKYPNKKSEAATNAKYKMF